MEKLLWPLMGRDGGLGLDCMGPRGGSKLTNNLFGLCLDAWGAVRMLVVQRLWLSSRSKSRQFHLRALGEENTKVLIGS